MYFTTAVVLLLGVITLSPFTEGLKVDDLAGLKKEICDAFAEFEQTSASKKPGLDKEETPKALAKLGLKLDKPEVFEIYQKLHSSDEVLDLTEFTLLVLSGDVDKEDGGKVDPTACDAYRKHEGTSPGLDEDDLPKALKENGYEKVDGKTFKDIEDFADPGNDDNTTVSLKGYEKLIKEGEAAGLIKKLA